MCSKIKAMWSKAQKWEADWWNTCQNTFGEEMKQLLYADRMGLKTFHNGKSPYNIDLQGKSVLDIGGGPTSLLLKCVNFKRAIVIDPCNYPKWIEERYNLSGIIYHKIKAEGLIGLVEHEISDEAWIYNVLQHTEEPEKVIKNARRVAGLIRLFEWIDTSTNEGHPHSITEKDLNKWLKGEGKVEELKGQNNCFGKCFYGIFPTKI